ncbi:MAG: hypothetical protein IID44_06520 [Planctomycetes bacterium]|nr:hypothetical protein [Planctomycetota bacterium]
MSPTTSPTENHSTDSPGTSAATSAAASPSRGGSLSNAVVLQRMEVSPGLIILRVAPDDWEFGEFQPGQFAVLGLPSTAARCANSDLDLQPAENPDKLLKRAYSIASSSVYRQYLEFYIVLISTGTGLAPYISMVRSQLTCGGPRRFAVLHGARHSWDLGYRSELETLERMCSNFFYIPSISRPAEEMIENMVQLLSRQGFREHSKQSPGQIHVERYW